MKSDFLIAVTQLAAERHLPREAVISAIEAALASAYKKDSVLAGQEISVTLNPANGELKLFTHKTAVAKVEDPQKEISLAEARKIQKSAALGDVIAIESDIQTTGRIAAQTAKQVVLQRLREAERELLYEEYADKEGDIVTGTVQRVDSRQITLDLGRAEAILPVAEQVSTERYRPSQKVKVVVAEVRRSARGPEIVVSRASKDLLRRLFEMEVPEIFNGIVEIKAIAREAGSRSKVAVHSRQENVDPVGSCVGLRGIRIQNIVNELQGEKIDVIQWHPDPAVFLANALSPCPVNRVDLDPKGNAAVVVVPDRQLSLAIGREGQNARLCAKLSGLMVNIKSVTEAEEERVQRAADVAQHIKEAAEIAETSAKAAAQAEAPQAQPSETERSAEPALEPARVLSIEEQLAEADLEAERAAQEPAVVEAETEPTEIPDNVWKVPLVAQQPQRVRFAEDIMSPRAEVPPAGRRRARPPRRAAEEEVPAKSSRRSRRSDYPIDDDEDSEDSEELAL
ncbi:MAG: transcription termination/antitermination protein NusA [Chloroflexi bacterium]|nr:transcription termination/antitermination protein NusA [Chloroflexota bacterium]